MLAIVYFKVNLRVFPEILSRFMGSHIGVHFELALDIQSFGTGISSCFRLRKNDTAVWNARFCCLFLRNALAC